MKTRLPIHGLLLTGVLGLALVAPASALSKSGSSLLESLRSKVDTNTPQPPTPETPAKPVVTFQTPSAPETGFEPGVIVPEPAADESPAPEPNPRPKKTEPAPKADTASTQAAGAGSLLGKPPAVREETTDTAAAPNMQDVLEKLETLRKRLEQGSPKNRSKKTPADAGKSDSTSTLKAPPKAPKAPKAPEPPAPAVLEAPAAAPTAAEPAVQEPRQPAAGTARQFGELTDAELIQYAHEHVWSSEKSRKHNPPVTPSAKSKKKSKDGKSDKAAPSKAGSKKPAAGPAKAATGTKNPAAASAKAPSVVVQKAVR
ncbi:MAG TPA: hypothetical protein PLP29_11710 [Candidatus Ozemobacteraceae bacterium]|nr:hypothetical protein [Candidatus Ozemobacteraceae bacterium]